MTGRLISTALTCRVELLERLSHVCAAATRKIGLTRAGTLQPGVGSDDTHLPFVVTEFDRTAGLGWRLPPTVWRQSPHTRPTQAPANGRCAPTAPRVARAVPRESSASRCHFTGTAGPSREYSSAG
jgi:hypothetical protein